MVVGFLVVVGFFVVVLGLLVEGFLAGVLVFVVGFLVVVGLLGAFLAVLAGFLVVVDFLAGDKTVFVTMPAAKSVTIDQSIAFAIALG